MKLLLINPNFYYFPGRLESIINYKQPSLGLAYLSSYIKNKHPLEVRICDAAALNLNIKSVLNYITEFRPDIIGISMTTPTFDFSRSIALNAKKIFPEIFIIFGGPHVTALPFENLDIADICVMGEGEQTFSKIINNYLMKLPFDSIKGIALNHNGRNVKTADSELIDNLDTLPFPDRDELPRNLFRHIYPYRLDTPYYDTIITSRGCFSSCNFCLNKLMWRQKVRYRSLDNVFEEIELLTIKYNVSLLFLRDDNFPFNPERAIEFCRRKQKYFPRLKWICHARADNLSLGLLREMESAGCLEIQIGVESGDDRILDVSDKGLNTLIIYNTFKLLKKTKINSWATFIIGNVGEKQEDIEKTIQFAKKIDPTYCSFLYLTPFPGTKCFDTFCKKGYIKIFDWSQYGFHNPPIFETKFLPRDLLVMLKKKAYIKFYMRPRILIRYCLAIIQSNQWKLAFSNIITLIRFLLGKN